VVLLACDISALHLSAFNRSLKILRAVQTFWRLVAQEDEKPSRRILVLFCVLCGYPVIHIVVRFGRYDCHRLPLKVDWLRDSAVLLHYPRFHVTFPDSLKLVRFVSVYLH
jgi:hypothetical protein